MKNLLLIKVCFVLLIISLIGCGSGNSLFGGNTGAITAKLDWSHISGKSLGKLASAVPAGVDTIRIVVSGPNMGDIQKDFPVADGHGSIDGVPVGSNLVVTAQGLINGFPTYEGLKGQITINAGQTTDIGTLAMLPSCISLISQGNVLPARDTCANAANVYGNATSNLADGARFFSAMSRVLALLFNMQSAGSPTNGLNTFGDVLNAFGCNTASGTIDPLNPNSLICPGIVPLNAPTGAQLQTFLANVIEPELKGAVQGLGKISNSFKLVWTEPFGGTQVTSDYADVLVLKAGSEVLLSSVIIENSYNLDANIANAVDNNLKTQGFLAANPNFLTLSNASDLSTAQSMLKNGLNDALSAINQMAARTGNQKDYFINPGNLTPDEVAKIVNIQSSINEFKPSLNGPTNIHFLNSSGDLNGTLDLTKFFAGMDVRSLLPAFSGSNMIQGSFPDPTFGGIWTNYVPGSKFDVNHNVLLSKRHVSAKVRK